jgi:hypothetical protein
MVECNKFWSENQDLEQVPRRYVWLYVPTKAIIVLEHFSGLSCHNSLRFGTEGRIQSFEGRGECCVGTRFLLVHPFLSIF